MALQGTLDTFALADVLRLLAFVRVFFGGRLAARERETLDVRRVMCRDVLLKEASAR